MNDDDLLYKAVVANPQEDTPRLAYADFLAERSSAAYDDDGHAEFIRLQMELHRIGRRVDVFAESPPRPAGPGRYLLRGDWGGFSMLLPGVRVDVRFPQSGVPLYDRCRGDPGFAGLLLTDVVPADPLGEEQDLVLVKDEYSVPFPHERYNRLTGTCVALHEHGGSSWTHGAIPPEFPEGVLEFERGFPSRLVSDYDRLRHYMRLLAENYPICEVTVTYPVPLILGTRRGIQVVSFQGGNPHVTVPWPGGTYAAEKGAVKTLLSKTWPSVPFSKWVVTDWRIV